MGEIFRTASLVLACVGPHADGSEIFWGAHVQNLEARDIAAAPTAAKKRAVTEGTKRSKERSDERSDERRAAWAEWAISCGADVVMQLFEAFDMFRIREYWERIWIVQEVVLACDMEALCGPDRMSWRLLYILSKIFALYGLSDLEGSSITIPARPTTGIPTVVCITAPGALHVDDLFTWFGSYRCSDVRDRIYGVLCLVNWEYYDRPALIPDYSLTMTEVALEVIKFCEPYILPKLVRSFGINNGIGEIQQYIERRRSKTEGDPEWPGPLPKPQRAEPSYRDLETARFAVIQNHPSGYMTAALAKRSVSTRGSSGPTSFLEGLDASDAVQIMVGSEIAVLGCFGTRAGDLLVHYWRDRRDIGLILRQNSGSTFDIIGQVVLLEGYRLCQKFYDDCTKCPVTPGVEHAILGGRLELCLTEEDLLTLFAQDVSAVWSDSDRRDQVPSSAHLQDHAVDPEAYMKRVTTRVTVVSHGTARVTGLVRHESWSGDTPLSDLSESESDIEISDYSEDEDGY